jgi:hypothetical protein
MASRESRTQEAGDFVVRRRTAIVEAAKSAGLLQGARTSIGARVPKPLIDAAKEKSGLASTTEVVEYALAKIAIEDDYGAKLTARSGKVSKDLDLEF